MDWVLPLVTLTAMEIVLGIDNIVFIAILAGRLPKEQRSRARSLGLLAAMGTRILLLLSITWVLHMDKPFMYLTDYGVPAWLLGVDPAHPKGEAEAAPKEPGKSARTDRPASAADEDQPASASRASHRGALAHPGVGVNGISVKDLILLIGGLFLIWKSIHEVHDRIEGHEEKQTAKAASLWGVVLQIGGMDVIFSLDSVITAVGMVDADKVWVMILAIVLAIGVMMMYAGAVSRFVDEHPTLKMLALSFLILIGVMLVGEGTGMHINKGYVYFAMAFSLGVELLNMKIRPKAEIAEDD